MNQQTNSHATANGVSQGRRAWTTSAAGTLVGSIAVAVIVFRGATSLVTAADIVQGDLINPPPPTNAVVVAAPAPIHAPAPGATTASATPPAPAKSGDYLQVGFDRLSEFPLRLHWVLVDPVRIKGVQKMMGDVPPDIKALDQSKIAVRGFMLPLKLDNGKVTEFFLLRTQARCCYGLPIQMNELLTVHMAQPGVKSIMDQPVTIYGRLHVTESHDDTGALTSIYTLDGDKMDEPASL